MTNVDSDRKAIEAIRDSLRANLLDCRQQYEPTNRVFIHTDEPLSSAMYPRVQVRKRGPSASEIIDIGPEFLEQRSLILDIQFWSAENFKWKNTDNNYLQDEELVKEWLHRIWTTLKAQITTLKTTYGITGLKMIDEDDPYLEPENQLYTGVVSVRIWYFRR